MMVSTGTAVLPVWRSPMMSSRWPRPIGTMASIALRPVCTGCDTDWRAITPGATFSITSVSLALIGPLPSIGTPSEFTTRPSSSGPIGTDRILPVVFTVSPSVMWVYSPRITDPTESRSRLSARPKVLFGNSSISPCITVEARTQGTVISVTDGICRVHGLADVMQGEMLEFPNNTFGLALNLERDSVGSVVLGKYEHITEGDTVKTTGRILEVPVGPELIGRVVNALGQPIDGKGPINAQATDVIEKVAPGVIWRKSVSQPVQTGLKAIDSMVPVGRGQRELIIGDRQTGKTAVAVDTIINQKGKDLFCVYV